MIALFYILLFISLYGISLSGGRTGVYSFAGGTVLNLGYLAYRWSFLGRVPVTERHDGLLAMALIVALSFPYFLRRAPRSRVLGVLPYFVLFFCFFSVFQDTMNTIEPSMNSPWFYLHTGFFTVGVALLAVATVAGILSLFERTSASEMVQYRLTLVGWLVYSLALVAGSVWFFLVYGAFWLWAARELWTAVSWFYYSFYLHGRLIRSLRGTPSVVIGIIGFVVVLFAYLGVTPILGSPWTQF